VLAIVGLIVAACGDGNATPAPLADPKSASTCDELADAIVPINQELIDSVGDMSLERSFESLFNRLAARRDHPWF
jgi:hypothetical protein